MKGTQGKIKDPTIWDITETDDGSFIAQRVQKVQVKAENLAEAKAKLPRELGGEVDVRGWHRQGASGQYLKQFVDLRDMATGAKEENGNGTEKVLEIA